MTVPRKIHEITKNTKYRNKRLCFMKYISVLFVTSATVAYSTMTHYVTQKLNWRKWNRKVFRRISLNGRQNFLIFVLSFKMPNKVEFSIFYTAYLWLATSIFFAWRDTQMRLSFPILVMLILKNHGACRPTLSFVSKKSTLILWM